MGENTRYIDDLFEGFACCQEKNLKVLLCASGKIMLVDLGGPAKKVFSFLTCLFIDLLMC